MSITNFEYQSFVENGYLIKRGLIPSGKIKVLYSQIEEILKNYDVSTQVGVEGVILRRSNADYNDVFFEIQKLDSFHCLSHSTQIKSIISELLSVRTEDILLHPRKFFRLSYPVEVDPQSTTGLHQDFRYVQGDVDTITVWIPLGAYEKSNGVLRILSGSHKHGVFAVNNESNSTLSYVIENAGEFVDIATDFNIGDAVFFHSLTVHGSTLNISKTARMSVDFRYQDKHAPISDASLYAPFHCPVGVPFDNPLKWSFDSQVEIPMNLVVTKWKKFDDQLELPKSRYFSDI